MKRLIMLLYMVVVIVSFAAEASQKGLSTYKGKDLRTLDEKDHASFMRAFRTLTGDKRQEKKGWRGTEPWWVAEYQYGPIKWILLEGYPGYDIPDLSYAKVHRFGETWNYLGETTFPTGYRMRLDRVDLAKEPTVDAPVLRAYTLCQGPFTVQSNGNRSPMAEARQKQCQVYVVMSNRVAMVRLEDGVGRQLPNDQGWNPPQKGLAPVERAVPDWVSTLQSSNVVEVLESLMWLSNSRLPQMLSMRRKPAVASTIRNLCSSRNAWVRDYATLIMEAQAGEVLVSTRERHKGIKGGKLLSWGELATTSTDVRQIVLKRDVVSDDDLKILTRFKQLEALDLTDSDSLTIAGISTVASIRSLKELRFSAEKVNGGLKPLTALNGLEVLRIYRCSDLIGQDYLWVAKLPNLKHLSLWWCKQINDEVLIKIGEMKDLRILSLWGSSGITDKGLASISRIEKLEGLCISHAKEVTPDGIAHLIRLNSLRNLQFGYMPLDDRCMEEIGRMRNLHELDLTGLDITDKGLMHLEALKNLSSVRIRDCKKVSNAAAKKFSR